MRCSILCRQAANRAHLTWDDRLAGQTWHDCLELDTNRLHTGADRGDHCCAVASAGTTPCAWQRGTGAAQATHSKREGVELAA